MAGNGSQVVVVVAAAALATPLLVGLLNPGDVDVGHLVDRCRLSRADELAVPAAGGTARRAGGRAAPAGSSPREHEVLHLVARGSNAEIAATLFLSEATVKSHIGAIFTSSGCGPQAVIVYAFDHGVVHPLG